MPWAGWSLRRNNTTAKEDPDASMRILRTHVAAQASELSTIATRLGELCTMRMLLNELVRNHATGFDQIIHIIENQADIIERLATQLANTGQEPT